MSKYPNLSEADSIIMEILWRDSECSSSAIVKEIKDKLNWSRQTVRSYLVRLEEKGLVKTKQINKRAYHYYPIVTREEYAADKTESILNKYYDSLPHMVAGILQKDSISENELNELEMVLQRARNKEA